MIDGVVCSPPWAESLNSTDKKFCVESKQSGPWAQGRSPESVERQCADYSHTPGQVGNLAGPFPYGDTPMPDCEWQDWHNCYEGRWDGGLLTPASMAHPAKMARGLLERILDHGLSQGYWHGGGEEPSMLADPFGGVGTTGLLAAYRGMPSISVELEERFVALAQQNIDLHRRPLTHLGCPLPVIVRGDSRQFAETFTASGLGYSADPANIGNLPAGTLDGAVTSPPYAESNQDYRETAGSKRRLEEVGEPKYGCGLMRGKHGMTDGYGTTPGQIGALPAGQVEGVVTSPPYAGGGHHPDQMGAWGGIAGRLTTGASETKEGHGYGTTPGQIGKDSGESYWQAVAQVYGQVYAALRPGGVMAVVVKDYVKQKQRVPLCDQTAQLLTSLGFTVFLRCRCWLVKEHRHPSLFGGEIVETTERKSFFRRLAEKKGSPRLDWEEVLWARR